MAHILSYTTVLLATLLRLCSFTAAQAQVAIYPGDGAFKYYGCYNETTTVPGASGAHALPDTMQSVTTTTPSTCLAFCGSYSFAGLEYGRECWCGQYLNSLSTKLPDISCNLPCAGNASAACGGYSTLLVYSKGTAGSGSGSSSGSSSGSGSGSSKKSAAGRQSGFGYTLLLGSVGVSAWLLL